MNQRNNLHLTKLLLREGWSFRGRVSAEHHKVNERTKIKRTAFCFPHNKISLIYFCKVPFREPIIHTYTYIIYCHSKHF